MTDRLEGPAYEDLLAAAMYGHSLSEAQKLIADFAHELAELQRLRMDELDLTGQKARIVGRIVDLIDPEASVDIVDFLRARLDEDEQTARAVEDRSAPWDGQWVADGNDAARTFNGHVLFYGHSGPLKLGLVDHIVRHDPARVLAEVEAKRQILRALESAEVALRNTEPGKEPHELMTGAANSLRAAVRLLALSYADHPDYRPEWRL